MTRKLKPEEIPHVVHELLESFFWLPELRPNESYARLHDDHDGKRDGYLEIIIGKDGDVWVMPLEPNSNGLRYRVPHIGGGASPRVRNALLILAEAIRLDNEENPLQSAEEYHRSRGTTQDPLAGVRWICAACNTVNAIEAPTCEGCKKPKPEVKST